MLARLDGLAGEIADLRREFEGHLRQTAAAFGRLQDTLQAIHDHERELRERLRAARARDSYELAYEDPDPLVTIVIPTFTNVEPLIARAVPSVLAQSHGNVEVVVVGDAAPPATGERLRELGDERVRYVNLPHRGPYPEEARALWHVAGVPPRNHGFALAGGRWIGQLDDDDALAVDHVERLLDLARAERAEVAYGRLHCVMTSDEDFELGSFPPRLGQFGWMAALMHADLRFFEQELTDALFALPADWALCRRMLRAGVRFAHLEEVVTEHYESTFSPDYEAS